MTVFFWSQKPDVAPSMKRVQKPVVIIQRLGHVQAIVLISPERDSPVSTNQDGKNVNVHIKFNIKHVVVTAGTDHETISA